MGPDEEYLCIRRRQLQEKYWRPVACVRPPGSMVEVRARRGRRQTEGPKRMRPL